MTNVGLRFREMLTGAYQVVQDELDQIIAGIQGTWNIEHNPDGTHSVITGTSLDVATLALNGKSIAPMTWTPVLGGSTATSGQAYNAQSGIYIKVGRLVMISFRVHLSTAGTVTGDAQIQGLPFTIGNYVNGHGGGVQIPYWANFTPAYTQVGGIANENSTVIALYKDLGSGTSEVLPTGDIANTSLLQGFGHYISAT